MSRFRSAGVIVVGLVAGVSVLSAPEAQAAPTSTQFSAPVVGLYLSPTGYAGGETALVWSTLAAVTDPQQPGRTTITSSGSHCSCAVTWRNETTGASGQWQVPQVFGFPIGIDTGSGKITATARVYGSISPTFVVGNGSWVVP